MRKARVRICSRLVLILAVLAVVLALVGFGFLSGSYLAYRNHWNVIATENEFVESNRELNNPYRGFYSMYGFIITDGDQNFYQETAQKMFNDKHELSLIEINLLTYKNKPITAEGLDNIKELFDALKVKNKQYIVRFLYDWNGKAMETEPEDIQVILGHMRQLKDLFYQYRDIIFVCQGAFVGNCGEMNNSRHMTNEGMTMLVEQLFEVTPEEIFLSVRTPAHWRIITGISEVGQFGTTPISKRLGLYNDGMMGTVLDTGTYGTLPKTEAGAFGKWNREEELAFQSELCKLVPNGGEVIIDNPVNDFENVVQSLKTMHVTYINRDYDQNVFNKWATSVVREQGVFSGMDGLTYVERHLGYRLYITGAMLNYEFWQDRLSVEVKLKNVGFSPMYREPEKKLVLCNKETGEIQVYPVEVELRTLVGGNDSEDILAVTKEISLAGFSAGEYEIFFWVRDNDTERFIEFANEQELTEFGYLIGEMKIEAMKNPITGTEIHFEKIVNDLIQR